MITCRKSASDLVRRRVAVAVAHRKLPQHSSKKFLCNLLHIAHEGAALLYECSVGVVPSSAGKVCEEISGRFDLAFQDMGEQQLKNIARNVRVYRVRLDNVAPTPLPQLALPDKPSILPSPSKTTSPMTS
jgi:hypothetical protein